MEKLITLSLQLEFTIVKQELFRMIATLCKHWRATDNRVQCELIVQIINEARKLNPNKEDEILKPIYCTMIVHAFQVLEKKNRHYVHARLAAFCKVLANCAVTIILVFCFGFKF